MAGSDREQLSLDAVLHRDLGKVRKGNDPAIVERTIRELVAEIKQLRSELDEARRDAQPVVTSGANEMDLGDATRRLGEETARIVEAAQEAAIEIKSKAESNAARMVRDAHERANQLTQRAAQIRDEAEREAEHILADADREGAARLAEASTQADQLRLSAEAELAEAEAERATVERETEQARAALRQELADRRAELERDHAAEAERLQASAVSAGKAIVGQALETRERVVEDLVERRSQARQQLEAMRAGRDALASAFVAVRGEVDGILEALDVSLNDARIAADRAARAVDHDAERDRHEIERELGDPAELVDDDYYDLASGTVESTAPVEVSDNLEVVDDGVEVADEVPAEIDEEAEEAVEDLSTDQHLRLVSSQDAVGGVDEDDLDDFEADDEEDFDEVDEFDEDHVAPVIDLAAAHHHDRVDSPGVDALFAKLRQPIEAEPSALARSADSHSPSVAVAPTVDAEAVLATREAALDGVESAVLKVLKRLVGDDENIVLDEIRRAKKLPLANGLAWNEDVIDRYLEALGPEIAEAVEAGALFALEHGAHAPIDADEVALVALEVVDEWCIAPLRHRLERSFAEDRDNNELVDAVRAQFREWRLDQTAILAGDLCTRAFSLGTIRSLTNRDHVAWVCQRAADGQPCADAEDNRLAGAIAPGEDFPTGSPFAPAHAGCRCVVVPVPS